MRRILLRHCSPTISYDSDSSFALWRQMTHAPSPDVQQRKRRPVKAMLASS